MSMHYSQLLQVCNGRVTIPDPFIDLKEGWFLENRGMESWPPVMQTDIATYLLTIVEDKDIEKWLMGD
ncbi:hypothetical protein SNE40_019861 [Patella caerulea]|uniref:Uncharacterized protein n=1 Tax=Patella caerulea TaxID=87958 RepID=A0AAN8G9X5_PATCE